MTANGQILGQGGHLVQLIIINGGVIPPIRGWSKLWRDTKSELPRSAQPRFFGREKSKKSSLVNNAGATLIVGMYTSVCSFRGRKIRGEIQGSVGSGTYRLTLMCTKLLKHLNKP